MDRSLFFDCQSLNAPATTPIAGEINEDDAPAMGMALTRLFSELEPSHHLPYNFFFFELHLFWTSNANSTFTYLFSVVVPSNLCNFSQFASAEIL